MRNRLPTGRWIPLTAVLLLILAGAYYAVSQYVHVSWAYCIEAEFAQLPPDDDALADWLRGQPGVVPNTVYIKRRGGGNNIEAIFIQSRNAGGRPQFPDLDAASVQFGYAGQRGPFRDCNNRSPRTR